jgi:serine/threonine protein kinase
VFRTYEPTRDRLVAVKLFRLDITPEQAQSLADELRRACDAGLFHPSIVEPIAAGVEGTAAYRAEEYVAAESLDVAIRHYAPAPPDKALPFITQLAGAIDFARSAGVGHGGLHLRDVFVTPEEARASGFGIVESLERVGIRAPVRRPYSAPERIAGASWSTPADVFSLAAITYELLTGRRPSGTGDQFGALSGEQIGASAAAVRAVLARAMDEDPARRYSTALAFASALEEAAHGGPVSDAAAAVETISRESGPDASAREQRRPAESLAHAEVAATPAIEPEPSRSVEPAPRSQPEAARRIESVVPIPAPIATAPEPPEEEPDAEETVKGPAPLDAKLREEAGDQGARMLFDEEEAPVDVAISEAPLRPKEPPKWQYEPAQESPGIEPRELFTEPERPRVAMLPVAFGLILGLLIGFAGGYVLGERGNTAPPSSSPPAASTTTPPPSTPAAPPQGSGKAWSEQAVTQPATVPQAGRDGQPRTAPPVPGDAPDADRTPTAPSSAGSRTTHATLKVESTPKNAAVTVNGRWRGRTPLTIDDLTFGTYTIRIVQPGYTVVRESVTLTKAQPARTLTFQLQRPVVAARPAPKGPPAREAAPTRDAAATRDRFSGSLFVASNPPGARVFVDGRPFGTAPARIPGIPIGAHVVRLELPDHRIWTTSTRVSAGQETRVTGSLERIQ